MKVEELVLNNLLSYSQKDASVHFMQQRVLILDVLAMGLLRKELIDALGYHKARKVLTRFGFAHGWRTAKMLQENFPEVLLDNHGGEHLHKLFGLVNTTTREELNDSQGKVLQIQTNMENSYEAEQHLNLIGQTDDGACWTLTGFASGFETFKHGREMYFIETQCVSKGDACCQMKGRFKEQWGHHLAKYHSYFEIDGIGKALSEQEQQLQQLEKRLIERRKELELIDNPVDPIPGFIARSPKMIKLISIASRVARVNSTVLVSGDSGVGKEHISRYIHQASSRSDGPFISVNCSAVSDSLLETELFGHAKGAFTGAGNARVGLLEEADGGTLFLDEIGETSLNMQVKLLRALQEKEIKRIGENTVRKLDIRVIVATNRNLSDEVRKGNFRLDLFYRLKVIELNVPNLSQRREDILPIANLLLQRLKASMSHEVNGLSRSAIQLLMSYNWPGNVRELTNAMEYAIALCKGEWVEESDLPPELIKFNKHPHSSNPLMTLDYVEKQHILATLSYHQGDKTATANSLGIVLSTLYRKLSQYEQIQN